MAYTKLIYHIVLRTRHGTAPIVEAYERNLFMYIFGFCKNHQCVLYRINGMPDHVHLLVGLHPTIAVSSFVHDLKIATNNFMRGNRDNFPDFASWEQGYCALTYTEADKNRVVQTRRSTTAGCLPAMNFSPCCRSAAESTTNDISESPLGHPVRVPSPTTAHSPRVLPKVVPSVTER